MSRSLLYPLLLLLLPVLFSLAPHLLPCLGGSQSRVNADNCKEEIGAGMSTCAVTIALLV